MNALSLAVTSALSQPRVEDDAFTTLIRQLNWMCLYRLHPRASLNLLKKERKKMKNYIPYCLGDRYMYAYTMQNMSPLRHLFCRVFMDLFVKIIWLCTCKRRAEDSVITCKLSPFSTAALKSSSLLCCFILQAPVWCGMIFYFQLFSFKATIHLFIKMYSILLRIWQMIPYDREITKTPGWLRIQTGTKSYDILFPSLKLTKYADYVRVRACAHQLWINFAFLDRISNRNY